MNHPYFMDAELKSPAHFFLEHDLGSLLNPSNVSLLSTFRDDHRISPSQGHISMGQVQSSKYISSPRLSRNQWTENLKNVLKSSNTGMSSIIFKRKIPGS